MAYVTLLARYGRAKHTRFHRGVFMFLFDPRERSFPRARYRLEYEPRTRRFSLVELSVAHRGARVQRSNIGDETMVDAFRARLTAKQLSRITAASM